MKYVICRDDACHMLGTEKWPRGGQSLGPSHHRHALVFSEGFTHSEVVKCLRRVYPGIVAESAGFVMRTPNGLACYGKSESLNMGPQPGDAQEIERQILFEDSP